MINFKQTKRLSIVHPQYKYSAWQVRVHQSIINQGIQFKIRLKITKNHIYHQLDTPGLTHLK